jgi:hypothetical protein
MGVGGKANQSAEHDGESFHIFRRHQDVMPSRTANNRNRPGQCSVQHNAQVRQFALLAATTTALIRSAQGASVRTKGGGHGQDDDRRRGESLSADQHIPTVSCPVATRHFST